MATQASIAVGVRVQAAITPAQQPRPRASIMSAGIPGGHGNHVFHMSRRWPLIPSPALVKLGHTLQWPRDFVDSDEAGKLLRPVEQELHQRTHEPNCPQYSRPMRPV